MEKITSRSNPVCIHTKKLGKSKSYRDEYGQFLCDGGKLLDEAIAANADILTILTIEKIEQDIPTGTTVYNVDKDLISSLSPLKTPQDVLFICRAKEFTGIDYTKGTHILLDNIQDPGNVGTILRSAYAFGIDSVILTEDSADIYNPKSVRASMGAIFKQRTIRKPLNEITELKKQGVKFIGTSNDVHSTDVRHSNFGDAIIVLGNEGKGISENLFAVCDEVVRIPLSPDCESLNAAIAASIIMWEATKRTGGGVCHH
ncbi:MAG: RNA methyltransferase [Oscillospiraceae bacterium]|nr:RNA methyltransferase [Oscillospiraceae bacterium]